MSRVGKKPIPVPDGVTANVSDDSVEVSGPKGKLRQAIPPGVRFELSDGQLVAHPIRENDRTLAKFHGLARTLVANAVHGVSQGFDEGARYRRHRIPGRGEGKAGRVRAGVLPSGDL